jgi:hypothetical protein
MLPENNLSGGYDMPIKNLMVLGIILAFCRVTTYPD